MLKCTLTIKPSAEVDVRKASCHFCKGDAVWVVAVESIACSHQGTGYVAVCDLCFDQLYAGWAEIIEKTLVDARRRPAVA